MSKMDELRALREARYERTVARAAAHPRSTPKPAAPTRPEPPLAAEPEMKVCGHRSISGRTCTRDHGHAAKSHRYS